MEFEEVATRGKFYGGAGFPDLDAGQGAADVRGTVDPFRCRDGPVGVGEVLDADDEVGADAAEDGALDAWAGRDEVPREVAGIDEGGAPIGREPQAAVAGTHAGGLDGTGEFEGAEAVGAIVEVGVEAGGAVVGDGMEFGLGNGKDAPSAREPEAAEPVVDHLVDGGIGESLGAGEMAEPAVPIAEQAAVEGADPDGAVGLCEQADDDLDGVTVRGGPVGDDLVSADEVETVRGADPERAVGRLADGTDVVVGEAVGAGEGRDGEVGADGMEAAGGTHPDVAGFVARDAPDGDGLPAAIHEERRELAVPIAHRSGGAGAEPEGAVGGLVRGEEEVVGKTVGLGEVLDAGRGDAVEPARGGEPDRAVAALGRRGDFVVGQPLRLADGRELGPLELGEAEAIGGGPDGTLAVLEQNAGAAGGEAGSDLLPGSASAEEVVEFALGGEPEFAWSGFEDALDGVGRVAGPGGRVEPTALIDPESSLATRPDPAFAPEGEGPDLFVREAFRRTEMLEVRAALPEDTAAGDGDPEVAVVGFDQMADAIETEGGSVAVVEGLETDAVEADEALVRADPEVAVAGLEEGGDGLDGQSVLESPCAEGKGGQREGGFGCGQAEGEGSEREEAKAQGEEESPGRQESGHPGANRHVWAVRCHRRASDGSLC